MSRELRLRLDDMRAACERALHYVSDLDEAQFLTDRRTQSALERELFVIGEASKHVEESFRLRHGEVEWREIAGMRDVLAHGYFHVQATILWRTAKEDLPRLLTQIEAMLDETGRP